MHVTFWGTRGSIAKAGPTTLRYGGNTSCVEVGTDGGTLLVIDCGTGAHGLGGDLMNRHGGEPIDGHLLISHTHWDHIQGLPFFAPLFHPDATWNIYGPRGLGGPLIETLAGQMQYSYFPITLEQLAAKVEYHDLVEGTFDIDDVTVTTHYLNHPALTLGYRIEADGAVLVHASDHEPHRADLAHGGDLGSSRHDRAHVEFLADADLVIHDAQYVAAEYEARAGWGHSTVEYVVDAARQAGARHVALFHHDPSRTDDEVDALVAQARLQAAGADLEVLGAIEGETIQLTGTGMSASKRADVLATVRPALDDVRRSVLLAVRNPEIAAIVREAAEAEGLEVHEVDDEDVAVGIVRNERPSVAIVEDGVFDLEERIGDLGGEIDDDVNVVTVTASAERELADSGSVIDWLRWPFSAGYVRTKLHALLLRRACRWQTAPIPDDEAERLEALRGLDVLDTPPEPRFDQVTKEVSESLDVPVALVSLVDAERQWFKSAHGFPLGETHRDLSFCSHAILEDDVMQIPDALEDPRFAENPAVANDPRVRFYAGAPLELSDGKTVGTLCVVDYRPRVFDDDQLDELRRLARSVVDELEAD